MRSSAKPPRMPSPVEQSLPVLGEEDVSEAVQAAGGHNFLKPMTLETMGKVYHLSVCVFVGVCFYIISWKL